MRVAIIGSRSLSSLNLDWLLSHIPPAASEIVSGGAAGVDEYARLAAQATGLPLREFLPDYERFGKQAPLRRNIEIIGYSDLVLAFWDGHSRGTIHVAGECVKRGVPVRLIEAKTEI